MNVNELNKGLPVNIYRNPLGDCTNGGLSMEFSRMILSGPEVNCKVFESEDPDRDDVLVFVRDFCAGKERLRAIPINAYLEGKWTMFGGNFCYSSDARFPSEQPIKIHDRIE